MQKIPRKKTIITSNPTGVNPFYNQFTLEKYAKITACFFWRDAITIKCRCEKKQSEVLKRLCFIANVHIEEDNRNYIWNRLKIVITSVKDLDRLLPKLKEIFPNDKCMEDDYITTFRTFFGDN